MVPSSPNVVPFRSSAPDPKAPALSPVERNAFHELARQLTARLKGEDEDDDDEAAAGEPAAQASHESQAAHPANNENAPPADIAQPATAGDDRPTADASELRLAQAQTRELKAILDTATDGVVVVEPDGRIVSSNRSAETLFGYDAADLTARGFAELFAPESRGVALDYLASLGARRRARVKDGREVTGRARQGGTIPLFMTLGRIADDSPRVCAVFRDITPWKKAERDLMAAKHDAEKASAAKSDFLAKISHEIRTPLNSIIGFSEVMIEERFGPIGNERYRDYLSDIRSSGGHVVALLNDLLDLSKIEAGKLELAFASLNLNEVVQGCVALMQPQANRERIIIRTSLSPSLRPVVADARSVRQIVLNLLSNSIKFTGAGGQVIVSTAQTAAGEVVLRVRDTGIGMDDKELAVALEPFRQLATSARWGSGGTGLGLPLTKALTEANRARFGITSKLNDGTLVEIAFPPPARAGRLSAERRAPIGATPWFHAAATHLIVSAAAADGLPRRLPNGLGSGGCDKPRPECGEQSGSCCVARRSPRCSPRRPSAAEAVDLLLVFAADVSRSVDQQKFQLQRDGYAAAITNPRVLDAIRSGPHHRIAVCFVEWSGVGAQKVVIDWTVIQDAASAQQFARPARRGAALVRGPHLDQRRDRVLHGAARARRRSRRRAAPSTCRATAPTMPAATSSSRATRRSPRASPSTGW